MSIQLAFLLLALLAALLTAFGVRGVRAIRRSDGRLKGMIPSVGLILLVPVVEIPPVLGKICGEQEPQWGQLIGFVLGIGLDLLLARVVWRWANRPITD